MKKVAGTGHFVLSWDDAVGIRGGLCGHSDRPLVALLLAA